MPDFRNPVERPEDHHPGWHRVHKIEEDKKGKEPPYSSESKAIGSKPLTFTLLALMLKKVLSLFISSGAAPATRFERKTLNEELIALRKLFQKLEESDLSRDPNFTEELQLLWHRIYDHCNAISLNYSKLKIDITELNLLISKIHTYNTKANFSLGEYLDKNAGIEWLPFPFLDLLRSLHEDHKKHKLSSILESWIAHINAQLEER